MILSPSEWQADVMNVPECFNIGMFGGRGAGRTTCALLMTARHGDQYGYGARTLFIRQTLRSLKEVEDTSHLMFASMYPTGLHVNRQDHEFRLPGGATCEYAPLSDQDDLAKLQGRSFSLIVADEYGNFSPQQMKMVYALRACLRAGTIPVRMILLANPGGRGHQQIKTRFVDKCQPWVPTQLEDKTEWVLCPGNFTDNPFNPPTYANDLLAAAAKDRELYRAWATGAWNIARGAMFADCIDEKVHMVNHEEVLDLFKRARMRGAGTVHSFVACDWGQSSPSVAFACHKLLAPLGPFSRGSLVITEEVSSADPEDLSVGMNWSLGKLAERIQEMCDRNGCGRHGVIDDARGLQPEDTLIKGMQAYYLYFRRPQKNRRSGWAASREMLTNAVEKNGKPGLWVAQRCSGWWATVPLVPRDPLNMEDVDTRTVDHWADTMRYAVTYVPQEVGFLPPREALKRFGVGGPGAPSLY